MIEVTRAVHRRPARVQRPAAAQRQRGRPAADVHREGQGVPREHRGQGPDDLPPAAAAGRLGPGGPPLADRRRRRAGAASPCCSTTAWSSCPSEPMKPRQLRRPRRVLHRARSRTTATSRTTRSRTSGTSPAGGWRRRTPTAEVSEPKKPIVFYIGREVPDEVAALDQEGVEAWQPAFEKAGFKNAIVAKDAPTAQRGPRLGRRGRPLLVDPLAPRHHRERHGPARPRPADRRDPRGRHPDVSQHPEADPRLVLRPGLAQRPAGPDAARCPTT